MSIEVLIIVGVLALAVFFYREIQKNKAEARELRERMKNYKPPTGGGDDEEDEDEEDEEL